MAYKMMVDLERCIGCWTCAMACKVHNKLEDDDFRIVVRTLGSGAGIDRPLGVYPNLKMAWQPVFEQTCTWCASRVAKGLPTMCEYDCPTQAIAFGDDSDEYSAFCESAARVQSLGYRTYELPDYENKKAGIVYASK